MNRIAAQRLSSTIGSNEPGIASWFAIQAPRVPGR